MPNPSGFVVSRTGAVVIRVTLTMIGKAAITYSYNLIYLYTPELYPTVIRGAGVGVGSMTARIGGVVAPLIADLVSQSTLFSTNALRFYFFLINEHH